MAHSYRFGSFTLDTKRGALLRQGNGLLQPIHVPPQPFRALEYLVARAGHLVSRQELGQAIWTQGIFVDQDLGLNHCIRRLRSTLDDDARRPRFIQTVPRRGFCFVAAVEIDRCRHEPTGTDGARHGISDQRIAVLPFASFSPRLVESRFGDSLAEEILREAFRVATPDRQIMALHRALQDTWEVSTRRARPDLILTGSARLDTDLLRILGYVVRAEDGTVVQTQTWQDHASDLGLETQRRAAEALVGCLLQATSSAAFGDHPRPVGAAR